MTMAASAFFIENPSDAHIVNAIKAVSPKKGATAYGLFAYKPIKVLPMKINIAVIVSVEAKSSPAVANILGLNINKYDIVKKVVKPANNSVFKFVLFSFSLNTLSNKFIIINSQVLLLFFR